MRILLIRHGATEWSEAGRHTGRTDLPLTSAGIAQARALGGALSRERIARTLVSPLQRAIKTAEIAGLTPYTVIDDLAEVDYGSDEGRTTPEIRGDHPGWHFFTHGTHGGETLAQVGERCARVLALLTGDDTTALVAHGHLLRIFTAVFLGEQPAWGHHLGIGTASIGVLGLEHGRPAIIRWNDQSHLGVL
ncbi:MAG: histidine phosphatase family protein [Myxococcota bacterium]